MAVLYLGALILCDITLPKGFMMFSDHHVQNAKREALQVRAKGGNGKQL